MADTKISADSAASALGGTELLAGVQSSANVKITPAQIKTFVSSSPTLVTPALGVPSSGTLTSCTGLPVSTGISGLGTGVATLLAGTPSGTSGLAGTASPTFTGSVTLATFTAGTQPAFNATHAGVVDVTGDTTFYTIVSWTEVSDRGSNFNPSTGTFTVPVTGVYFFSVYVQVGGLAAGNNRYLLQINASDGQSIGGDFGGLVRDTNNRAGMTVSGILVLAQNATVTCRIEVEGGTKVVDVLAGTTWSGAQLF